MRIKIELPELDVVLFLSYLGLSWVGKTDTCPSRVPGIILAHAEALEKINPQAAKVTYAA